MTRAPLVLAAACAALAGCTRPCKPGSIFAHLRFDAASAAASSLTVQLVVDGKTLTAGAPHPSGSTADSIEIDFPDRYARGKSVDIAIRALEPGGVVGEGHAAAVVLSASCTSLSIDVTGTSVDLPPPDMAGYGPAFGLSVNATNKMDILFMIDNSPSMTAMQSELQSSFASFVQPFSDLAKAGIYSDLHIGVVTSDYGAGDTSSTSCAASPGGQKGFLQAIGAAAATGCVAPTGAPFISYKFDSAGDQSNLPGGSTPDALVKQFGCMASVGAQGCGFEHQLESVYQALRNTVENAGFLRADALLAVVLLTNEDDGSAPPTAKFYEAAADVNVYGAYDTYRQTRFAVACNGMPIPYTDGAGNPLPQPLGNCAGLPNPLIDRSAAFDASRYTYFFTQPQGNGGVKASPSDVLLVSIDGPDAPVQTILAQRNSGLGVPPNIGYVPCGPALDTNCLMRLQHSCQNMASPGFFADPAVRIHSVVNAAANHQIFSICGDDPNSAPQYAATLATTASLARARILGNCVPTKIAHLDDPDCEVVQTVNGTSTPLPRCDRGGAPCWTLTAQPSCGSASPDQRAIVITRAGPPPAGAALSARCRTP
jgi:hypothetical protein